MIQSTSTIRVLVNLPNLSSYQDTYHMFLNMLPYIDVLYIMTTAQQPLLHSKAGIKLALQDHPIALDLPAHHMASTARIKQVYIVPIPRHSARRFHTWTSSNQASSTS